MVVEQRTARQCRAMMLHCGATVSALTTWLAMPGLLPDIDPNGLLEISAVYADRSLNHMLQRSRWYILAPRVSARQAMAIRIRDRRSCPRFRAASACCPNLRNCRWSR